MHQKKDSPLDHPWDHTTIQNAESADPSNARSEFRGRRAILGDILLNNCKADPNLSLVTPP